MGTLMFFANKTQPSLLVTMAPFLIIGVLFYVMLYLPQKKKEQSQRDFLSNLKKGDKILTTSGIYGEVFAIETGKVVVEIAPKVKITMQLNAIAGIEPGSVKE